ncbi:MAG: hypothetical protein RLZZ401_1869, partial [Pseudomonadota bacterium]
MHVGYTMLWPYAWLKPVLRAGVALAICSVCTVPAHSADAAPGDTLDTLHAMSRVHSAVVG